MELVMGLPGLQTAAAAIGARPAANGDGVDITKWRQAGFNFSSFFAYCKADGADRTAGGPGGFNGALGVEVWMQIRDTSGTLGWWLIGYLNSGNAVIMPNGSGSAFLVNAAAIGERLALAGSPSAGAPTYYFAPVEHSIEAGEM